MDKRIRSRRDGKKVSNGLLKIFADGVKLTLPLQKSIFAADLDLLAAKSHCT